MLTAALANDTASKGRTEAQAAVPGPVLVLGATTSLGASLLKTLAEHHVDVYGVADPIGGWRLRALAAGELDLGRVRAPSSPSSDDYVSCVRNALSEIAPRTVFNCLYYGADSTELDPYTTYRFNLELVPPVLELLAETNPVDAYVQVRYLASRQADEGPEHTRGTGLNPYTTSLLAAGAILDRYSMVPQVQIYIHPVPGTAQDGMAGLSPAAAESVLRLAGVLAASTSNGRRGGVYHLLTDGSVQAALAPAPAPVEQAGPVGVETRVWPGTAETMPAAVAPAIAQDQAASVWSAEAVLPEAGAGCKNSVSVIVACYNEEKSIPVMYQRLKTTFAKLGMDHEIIFVNNGSTDRSEQVIRELSERDPVVTGITHSRSFGAEASFRSGLELARRDACVLLDGDLQDPPEMIEQLVEKWREGYDVVYGERIKREAPLFMQISYKLFYRIFAKFSYVKIPRDAGDFSLVNTRVVRIIEQFPERDRFFRGIRAYVGFKQTGVPYERPERMFGKTSNNLLKNIGWAKKGIFSFSRVPLDILGYLGVVLFFLSLLGAFGQVMAKLLFPESTAWGITTVLVVILLLGSVNLLGISIVGEYVAKVFDEVKMRPHFIRQSIVRNGRVMPVSDELRFPKA